MGGVAPLTGQPRREADHRDLARRQGQRARHGRQPVGPRLPAGRGDLGRFRPAGTLQSTAGELVRQLAQARRLGPQGLGFGQRACGRVLGDVHEDVVQAVDEAPVLHLQPGPLAAGGRQPEQPGQPSGRLIEGGEQLGRAVDGRQEPVDLGELRGEAARGPLGSPRCQHSSGVGQHLDGAVVQRPRALSELERFFHGHQYSRRASPPSSEHAPGLPPEWP